MWMRRPQPETRWAWRETVTRLGRVRGTRECGRRLASYWLRRAFYTYWECRDGGSVWFHRQPRFWRYRPCAPQSPDGSEGVWDGGVWQRKPAR